MKKLLIALLALGLVVGLGLAQDDANTQDHSEHSEEQSKDDEMDHGDHNDMSEMGEALNVVLVSDSSLTLEPLISADGTFTLGVRVEPPAELSLSATSPSGQEMALTAVPVMAMTEDMKEEGHTESESHEEGEHDDGEHSDEDMTEDEHGDDMAEDKENHEDHDMESMADVRKTLTFNVGAVEEGVWRFGGTLVDAEVAFPLSIYKASTEQTDVYLALAPSPTLSTRGLAEAFVYAFRDGEVVHNGMMMGRSMEGMQHSTDEEQLGLVHNHFNDVYNDTLGYGPMANQSSLGFAMAGTWDIDVMIMGDTEERLNFDVVVLEE